MRPAKQVAAIPFLRLILLSQFIQVACTSKATTQDPGNSVKILKSKEVSDDIDSSSFSEKMRL
jgi:hypothetical protein